MPLAVISVDWIQQSMVASAPWSMRVKRLSSAILGLVVLLAIPLVQAQPSKKTAVLPAGGSLGQAEQRLANELITKLVDGGSVEVVDRQKTKTILAEQNIQATDRYSPESATRLGKLLGVPTIVFVRIDSYSSTTRVTNSPIAFGMKTTNTGSVLLKGAAQILDVETGAILAAPSAEFAKDGVLAEVKTYGNIRKSSDTDPQVELVKLNDSAFNSLAQELAPKIAIAIPAAAAQSQATVAQKVPKVAGVQSGMTYLNAGSTSGIKAGDTFQITREVDSGMQDPDTHQPIMRKKKVCLLIISDVDDSIASGKCAGDAAQSGDRAVPVANH
jgi:hypothetical protein